MRWKKPFLELAIITALASFSLAACGQQKTESQASVQESETIEEVGNNESDDIIKQTTDSLKPYLDYIGTNTSSGDVEVSQEFLDNLNNVFVMNYTGTVNHALTEGAGDTITSMDWKCNETMSEDTYNDFLGALDNYFGSRGVAKKYENISQNDIWVWPETDDSLWPISFYENGIVIVRWYAESAVNISDEANTETAESAVNTSDETNTEIQDNNNNNADDQVDKSPAIPERNDHSCIECGKPATHSMTGIASGEIEWYCDDHWSEMNDLLNDMQKELDEVEELTNYDAYLNYGSGSIPFWISEDALDRYISASVKDNQGTIDEMTTNGEIGFTPKGTKCNIVKKGYTKCQVKLLDGSYSGSTVWVLAEAVHEVK